MGVRRQRDTGVKALISTSGWESATELPTACTHGEDSATSGTVRILRAVTAPTTLDCMHDYSRTAPRTARLVAARRPTVLILGATLYAGLAEPWPVIILLGLAAGCAAFLIALGLATVEIRDGTLRAGNAVLPLSAVSEVVSLDEKQTTRLRGPRATRRPTCIRDPTSRNPSTWPSRRRHGRAPTG